MLFLAIALIGCAGHKEGKVNVSNVSNVNVSSESMNVSVDASKARDKINEVKMNEVNETEILKIASLESGSITKLTPQNLTELAEKYPVIYGNLPNKTLYQIKTEKQLIIVDAEEKKILRKFRVVGISLGG